MLIHHLTDTHYPRPGSRLPAYFRAICAAAKADRPDLIVHTGDLVDGQDSPDLPADLNWPLGLQHGRLKEEVDRLGVPFHATCHTHDRRGDPEGERGRTFLEVWGQPLLRVLRLPDNLDVILASGSVTLAPFGNGLPAPSWGFDLFDLHVLDALRACVQAEARHGSHRMLCTHLPVFLPQDYFELPSRYKQTPIGEEGCGRILPVLRELGVKIVLGGHLHRGAAVEREGIRFIVGQSTLPPYNGYGELRFEAGRFEYRFREIL